MAQADWRFARRPRWLLSHLFAVTVVALFVTLGFWQLSRLDQRKQLNERIEDRAGRVPVSVTEALSDAADVDELDFVAVVDRGRYLADEQVVVRNRSQGGAAGSWVVTPLATASGATILVNRGFVPEVLAAPDDVAVPAGEVEVKGWLRRSQQRQGFGPRDAAEGRLDALARLDVERIDAQVPDELVPVWLQLAAQAPPPDGGLPDPVPLPPLDEGNHLSYAVQWFIFATLGVVVYLLLLRKRAREAAGSGTVGDELVGAAAGSEASGHHW